MVTTVPAMVRIEVEKTRFKKIIVCFLFPSSYPSQHILVELKSKTLKDKLLRGLTKVEITEGYYSWNKFENMLLAHN